MAGFMSPWCRSRPWPQTRNTVLVDYDVAVQALTRWADEDPNVRAVVMTGSGARGHRTPSLTATSRSSPTTSML